MLQFFHGWRRKVGVIALVVACGLSSAWMRSYRWGDLIDCPVVNIRSEEGFIWCSASNGDSMWGVFAVSPGRGHSDLDGIHYSMVVVPLVFLSAYLILWKPRKRA